MCQTLLACARIKLKVWLGAALRLLKLRPDDGLRESFVDWSKIGTASTSGDKELKIRWNSFERRLLEHMAQADLQRADRMERVADELAGSTGDVPNTTDLHDVYQAAGPSRPRRRILVRMLESIPGHAEIQSIAINGQTGKIYVETYHEGLEQVVELDVYEHEKNDPYLPAGD